jgi:hypothetical protein
MRKLVPVAAAIATSVSVVALPAALAYAAAPVHVLTINKVGGPAVKVGAVVKSGLAKGASAVFSLPTPLGTAKLTCKSAAFSAKVKTNPAKPGAATESITAASTAKCTLTGISGVAFKSIKSLNLPYKVTVSDATGLPVKISGQSTTKPVEFTVVVAAGTTNVKCNYKATSISGTASNTGNKITFSKQKFVLAAGSNSLCKGPVHFSATFGPVKDSSVTNSPAVFVN